MNKLDKKKLIILAIAAIFIVIAASISLTYAFMSGATSSKHVTELVLQNCAQISLKDNSTSIITTAAAPMSRNAALNFSTPYSFKVSSSCDGYVGFKLYMGLFDSNDIPNNKMHYIVTAKNSKVILTEGLISDLTESSNEFTNQELNQFQSGTDSKVDTIYLIYTANIPLKGYREYDLYLYIDETYNNATTETFKAGLAIKAFEREEMKEDMSPEEYAIILGENQTYTKETNTDLVFGADGEHRKFESFQIDDVILSNADYILDSETVTITVNGEYLENLALGIHTAKIVMMNGETSTTFTVAIPVCLAYTTAQEFVYTDPEAIDFDVECKGVYKLEVWGAQGGTYSDTGGKGGYSRGLINLEKNDILYLYVGGTTSSSTGGFNGGGNGTGNGKGGGGASDIRVNSDSLYSRVIVAGGGGGSGVTGTGATPYGGGESGGDGYSSSNRNGFGASQTAGGTTWNSVTGSYGSFGQGGNASGYSCGGGGGGWYGGGGAYDNDSDADGRMGGGGSGYIYNALNVANYPSGCTLSSSYYLDNAVTLNGASNLIPKVDGSGTETGHTGAGAVKITFCGYYGDDCA